MDNVLNRAARVRSTIGFLKRIAFVNPAVLGASAARAPTAARNLQGHRHVERGSIDARLSAAHDLLDANSHSARSWPKAKRIWRSSSDSSSLNSRLGWISRLF